MRPKIVHKRFADVSTDFGDYRSDAKNMAKSNSYEKERELELIEHNLDIIDAVLAEAK